VNGDGYSDVIVGDRTSSDGGDAFVWHGSASGLGPDGTPANADWSADLGVLSSGFPYSVATAGDVNGDGYDDVIVGAPWWYNNDQYDEGGAFVWLGSPSGLGDPGTPANADWSAEGDQVGAWFGWSVATAGDVDGDGYSDVIVGARGYDGDYAWDHGRAYVYRGSPSGLSFLPVWTGEIDLEQLEAQLGWSVAMAGDVNGDSYDDFIVGAPYYDYGQCEEGRAFLYYGSPGPTPPSAVRDWSLYE